MNSYQPPQQQLPSNLADQAIRALSLLEPEEQRMVLDYINALVDSDNEQGNN